MNNSLPLEGIKIIEVAQWVAAPAAGAMLADLGAEVIHVEHPKSGDAYRNAIVDWKQPDLPNYRMELDNRNKKGVAIDLSNLEGQEVVRQLIKQADVFISNLRPYETVKWGLEYERLAEMNPRIIVANLNGPGQRGPEKDEPGNDLASFWARTGIMDILPSQGMIPPASRGGFGDHLTSGFLTAGIALALLIRDRTGIGQEVDVSLFNTGIYGLAMDYQLALNLGWDMKQPSREETANPLLTYYPTKDGRWILLSIPNADLYWSNICKILKIQNIEHDERFNTHMNRLINNVALIKIIEEAFAKNSFIYWKIALSGSKIPWSPVQNIKEVIEDPQTIANEYIIEVEHPRYGKIKMLNNPIKFRRTPATVRNCAPELGENTNEVLLDYGYGRSRIDELKRKGIIK